jgi:glycine/D-amino acid oxidase-like deaminating enzyme
MDLHSSYPFWMIKEGILNTFPKLHECTHAEVVVIGAGISGALIAHQLCEAGLDVLVLEKRHVAYGSTSASTAMLQYEIDVPLFELARQIGKKNAARAYQVCSEAIDEIEQLCRSFEDHADFEKLPSVYYASYPHHDQEIIQPEFKARKAAGFAVDLLSGVDIRQDYGFAAPSGIRSAQGGHVNPYKLCYHLLAGVQKRGGRVYDSIEITRLQQNGKEVMLWSAEGLEIKAKYVVVACGYESQRYLPIPVTLFNASYAIVSTPVDEAFVWKDQALIWETKTPYLYMRTTADQRLLVGGRDERTADPNKRDSLIPFKKVQLENDFKRLFPHIPFDTDYAWAGLFGETEDGLPYIGAYDQDRVLYAMNYGGNGITFSVAAAHILTDAIRGKKNADADLFSFSRLKKVRKPSAW